MEKVWTRPWLDRLAVNHSQRGGTFCYRLEKSAVEQHSSSWKIQLITGRNGHKTRIMFVPWSSLCLNDRVCLMRRIALDVTGSGGGRAAATLFLSFCIIWTRHELKYRHGLCVWQHRTNGPLTDTIEAGKDPARAVRAAASENHRKRNTSVI